MAYVEMLPCLIHNPRCASARPEPTTDTLPLLVLPTTGVHRLYRSSCPLSSPCRALASQISRAKVDHQAWLRGLQAAKAAAAADDPSSGDKAVEMPWPEPDFFRL